jgi:hypothetical protein
VSETIESKKVDIGEQLRARLMLAYAVPSLGDRCDDGYIRARADVGCAVFCGGLTHKSNGAALRSTPSDRVIELDG